MKQVSSFIVTEFANPSGQIVFRVSGQLNGERVRKKFSTRADADAEKKVLEIQALQAETGIRAAATRLTDQQLLEAEAAFARLKEAPKPLLFYVEYALANYREPQKQKPLAEAVSEYVAIKERELARTLISIRQVVSVKHELKNLTKRFSKGPVSQFTGPILLPYLERGTRC